MNKDNHKISIIMPCYNCVDTLEEALTSVYTQDFDIPYEVIMVNDGSTDDTLSLIKNLSNKYKNVKYYSHDKNRGGGAARNTGIKHSTGTLIFCLDSDNILAPESLSKMVKHLIDNNHDGVIFYEQRFFKGNNKKAYKSKLNEFPNLIKFKDLYLKNPVYLDNFLFTKKSFLDTLGYPENHGFDTQCFEVRYLANNPKLSVCPDSIFYHRQAHNKKSYFEREYESGVSSMNYYLILEDVIFLFSPELILDIFKFDIFTKNNNSLTEDLRNYIINNYPPNKIFRKNYQYYLTKNGYEKFLEKNKNSGADFILCTAIYYYKTKNYKKALELFTNIHESEIESKIIYFNIFRCLLAITKKYDFTQIENEVIQLIPSLRPQSQTAIFKKQAKKTMLYNMLKRKLISIKNISQNLFNKYKAKKYSKNYNKLNREETDNFTKNYKFYKETYLNNKNSIINASKPFVLKIWSDYTKNIEKYFLNNFNTDFLLNDDIRETMFIRPKWQNQQLEYLNKKYSKEKLKIILKEEKIGQPFISNQEFNTSANNIHLLNHLTKFKEKINFDFKDSKNIIEWGAGYGSMIKILFRMNSNITYTLIDLPIFSFIQAVYLSNIFGKEKINLIINDNQAIAENKINIIPVNKKILSKINHPNYDVFISTWALSESNEYSQNFVQNSNYFNSKYLLIAHQEKSKSIPFANNIINHLSKHKIIYHKKIHYIRGENCYLFAKRNN
jgi:putative sugar O-methyltransferase